MRILLAAWVALATALGCGSGDGPQPGGADGSPLGGEDGAQAGPQLPHVTPLVRAALPPGLGGTSQGVAPFLNPGDIKTRFFSPGPTNIYGILEGIDGRIDDINQRTGACTTQAPVAYAVEAWGQTLTAYAQCLQDMQPPPGNPPAFTEFGTAPDGSTWINVTMAGSTTLAQLTPIAGGTGQYAVHLWLTIPVNQLDCTDPFSRGSYGVVELVADASTNSFEMVVAGTGFGFCGAQLKSDGTSVYFTGSVDTGATCLAIDSTCGAASDIEMPATCGTSTTSFALASIGREAAPSCSVGASQYPASGNTVDISGTATDSVQSFQTTEPTPGVGSL